MKTLMLGIVMSFFSMNALAHDTGLITKQSKHGFLETQSRLEAAIKDKGLMLFAKVDHGEGAAAVGLKMQPAIVTLFGNPKGGTPFMAAVTTAGIDFPLKALVWEDAAGKVYVSYNSIAFIKERHGISGLDELSNKLTGLLAAIAAAATD